MPAKSYWGGVCCSTARDKEAVLSWFSPVCDDMTPEKCEVLSDIETEATKKIRVVMVRADGGRLVATMTLGKRSSSIKLAPLPRLQEATTTTPPKGE